MSGHVQSGGDFWLHPHGCLMQDHFDFAEYMWLDARDVLPLRSSRLVWTPRCRMHSPIGEYIIWGVAWWH